MSDKDSGFDRLSENVEDAYYANPTDMKARISYLEAGIKEVRARLTLLKDWDSSTRYARFYWDGVKDSAALTIRLLDEILMRRRVPQSTRDGKED